MRKHELNMIFIDKNLKMRSSIMFLVNKYANILNKIYNNYRSFYIN